MTYALLQLSLDQTICRQDLEEASMAVPSVTRADCALLQRELFGIVVGNLPRDEALALQAALRARNFPTELVEQSALPVLPRAKRGEGLKFTEAGIALVDMYGREQLYAKQQFVFAAAGHVERLRNVPHRKMEWTVKLGARGSLKRKVEMVTENRLEDVPEFRIEFFFAQPPYRLQWILENDRILRINDEPYRLRDADRLLELLKRSLPADRVNLGIRQGTRYPSVRAFEEEIIWSLDRRSRASG